MKASLAVALVAGLLVGACARPEGRARNDMEQSLAAYKSCLAQQLDVSRCEAMRLTYAADLARYNALASHTVHVNTGSDYVPPMAPAQIYKPMFPPPMP